MFGYEDDLREHLDKCKEALQKLVLVSQAYSDDPKIQDGITKALAALNHWANSEMGRREGRQNRRQELVKKGLIS